MTGITSGGGRVHPAPRLAPVSLGGCRNTEAQDARPALCPVATQIGGRVMCGRQEQEAALGAAVEFTKDWMGLAINAIAVPAIVYWVLANALHLERVSRGNLATMLELAALGVVVWRCRNAARSTPEQ